MAETIPELKRAFLGAQVRLLSAPLAPAPDWRADAPPPSADDEAGHDAADLPEKAVEAALVKANGALRQHNAAVYPPVALAHVARQIDALYRAAVPPASALRAPSTLPPDAIPQSIDLTTADALALLPDAWSDEEEDEADDRNKGSAERPRSRAARKRKSALETDDAGARYARARARLARALARRDAARRRAEQARALLAAARPLRTPRETVQGSLVTRDGALAREAERTVVLAARLRGKREAAREAGGGARQKKEDLVAEADMCMGAARGMAKRARVGGGAAATGA